MKKITWYDTTVHLQPCQHHIDDVVNQGITKAQFEKADEIISDLDNHTYQYKIDLDDNNMLFIKASGGLNWKINPDGEEEEPYDL